MEKLTEGWDWLLNSPAWHYFRGGKSLCHRWGRFGLFLSEDATQKAPHTEKLCPTCLKKRNSEILK